MSDWMVKTKHVTINDFCPCLSYTTALLCIFLINYVTDELIIKVVNGKFSVNKLINGQLVSAVVQSTLQDVFGKKPWK